MQPVSVAVSNPVWLIFSWICQLLTLWWPSWVSTNIVN